MDSFFSFFCFTHIRTFIKKFWSIHYFLTITLLSILTLVMIFIGIINYWQVYRESARLFDTELAASASVLNTIVENKLTIDTYHDEFLFQVFNVRTGQILFKSDDAPIEPITEKDRGYDTYKNHTQSWRTFSLFNPKENIRIIVAMKKDFSFEFQMDVFIHDLQTLVLVYLMIGIAIYLVIQKGLKALNHTVNEISKRNGENLSAIDIGKVPLELRPVIQEINRLFSRVDESFAREKRFTADAAHELRTPLAALKTQVEIAKKELDKTKRIEILNKIIEGTNRCSHVVDQLLALSRLEPEALALSKLDSIDLVAIAESLIVNIIPLAIEKDIELELIAPSHPVFIMGKVPAIEILLRNLIANSINYTPHGGQIQVIVSQQQEDSDIVLQVIDNGIGVPEEFHERIFDRFFRQLGNKQPGSGLGLSIVTQVVRLHHGRIRAKTPANGKGLEIEVTFPSTK
jgi:two-component system sensor histidine kinase QseC